MYTLEATLMGDVILINSLKSRLTTSVDPPSNHARTRRTNAVVTMDKEVWRSVH